MTPEDIIKKHTDKPDADYSNSWVKAAMLEYGRLKWNQACETYKEDMHKFGYTRSHFPPKPEFKP